jgi:protein O-GlcNAc transferase
MDAAGFVPALEQAFDDFPRSERPRDPRFAEVLEAVPGLARENNLALLNVAASLLGRGESYVEVGTYRGTSLIAAMLDNAAASLAMPPAGRAGSARAPVSPAPEKASGDRPRRTAAERDFVGIDNFSFRDGSRDELAANLERFGVARAEIIEGDAFELLRGGALAGKRVGVYYYDNGHEYEQHLDGLRLVEPYLASPALLIVDDSDWERVARATRDYLAAQHRARLLLEIEGKERGQPWWWEGVQVLAWEAPKAS